MKVYTYIITQPDGKMSQVCGAVFNTETDAMDALYDLYSLAYQLWYQDDKNYFKVISRGDHKHRFNAYILDFKVIDR